MSRRFSSSPGGFNRGSPGLARILSPLALGVTPTRRKSLLLCIPPAREGSGFTRRGFPPSLPPAGYDSRIGSGRRAFGSGYRRDDDYRGCGDRYEDRYDRRDDRMDRWNSRDDYGRDDFRRDDRGNADRRNASRCARRGSGVGFLLVPPLVAPSQVPLSGRS